jgi:hypothetical protein
VKLFKYIKLEVFFVEVERKWFLKKEMFYTRTLHEGKFDIILMGTLVGLKRSNFICGKLFIWETL